MWSDYGERSKIRNMCISFNVCVCMRVRVRVRARVRAITVDSESLKADSLIACRSHAVPLRV